LGIDWRTVERPGDGPILLAHVEAAAKAQRPGDSPKASPVARRLAETAGLDLAAITARSPGKRIQRADVEAAIAARDVSTRGPVGMADADVVRPAILTAGEEVFYTKRRQVIAQHMSASAHTAAAVPLTAEVDATALVSLRERLKEVLSSKGMIVPTYTDLLVKLTAVALQEHPGMNAHVQEDRAVVFRRIDIGIAVDAGEGLLVPVVRDVPDKSLQQLAQESHSLVERARAGSLSPFDLEGGTFTVTNLGMYGVDTFAPIINPPQCAILGVGRIVAKPVVFEGQIVPRQMITISLTFDHRAVDGGPAARFLATLREYIEEPYLWLSRC
jgi:pyruvate dehydrogenase E2 component (dihydrolipoamide acetyltransferase)